MVDGKTEIFSRKKFLEKKGIFISMPFKIGFVGRWVSVVFMFKNHVWSSDFQYGQKEGMGRNGTNFLRSDNTLSVLVFSWAVAELKIQVFFIQGQKTDFSLQTGTPIHYSAQLYFIPPTAWMWLFLHWKQISQQMGFDCSFMSDDCRYLGWDKNYYL